MTDPLLADLARRRIELGYHPDKIRRALGWSGQAQIRQLEAEGNPRLSTLRRWADEVAVRALPDPVDFYDKAGRKLSYNELAARFRPATNPGSGEQ